MFRYIMITIQKIPTFLYTPNNKEYKEFIQGKKIKFKKYK